MPYLIDGHNLIPKLGINLSAEDDERQLVDILQNFARITRKTQLEIYFDRGTYHEDQIRFPSSIKVKFVKFPKTADLAIADRLRLLGNSARNWTVVSSDHYVQREGKSCGALVISSEDFALTVKRALMDKPQIDRSEEKSLSQTEVEDWINFFKDENKSHK